MDAGNAGSARSANERRDGQRKQASKQAAVRSQSSGKGTGGRRRAAKARATRDGLCICGRLSAMLRVRGGMESRAKRAKRITARLMSRMRRGTRASRAKRRRAPKSTGSQQRADHEEASEATSRRASWTKAMQNNGEQVCQSRSSEQRSTGQQTAASSDSERKRRTYHAWQAALFRENSALHSGAKRPAPSIL